MVQKRPLGEEMYEVSPKQPRHVELSDKRVSVLEFPGENASPKAHSLGEGGAACAKSKSESDERLDNGNLAEFPICAEKEIETSFPGFISNSSWGTSTTSEEDVRSEAPFCILLSPNRYNFELPVRTVVHSGDPYSSLWEYPPRKLVPVGRDFQADIPEWCGHGSEKLSGSSAGNTFEVLTFSSQPFKSDISGHLLDENKFAGSCLVPMPGLLVSADPKENVGGARLDCSCDDVGSIRCIQQHICQAREKLRKSLGDETFIKLGFLDMGEVVAEKWSIEEKEIFHEVVFANPASLGKNFWSHLAVEFPSRSKKEIVSYYFNVFLLRRRAEQNRVDALDIDSDNDEWEGANVSADDVIGKINGYDDSVVDSLAYGDDFGHDGRYEDNMCEHNGDITREIFYDDAHQNVEDKKFFNNLSEMNPNEVPENCSSDPALQPPDQILSDKSGNHHVQDGPCTSDDARVPSNVAMEKAHDMKHWARNLSSMSCSGGHEFLLEPRSSKEWDVGYLTCSKDEDLLPTSSVIEEVFGAGAWNYQTRDG
ncbi:hypothetical protein ACH5RR_025806 [Cinchona calisaya]|uniref:Myb-like domain-containing protein n=1 Tax=Cinchona calisaya TaxID=153742 RepID=A0ABD2Z0P8_9GENT